MAFHLQPAPQAIGIHDHLIARQTETIVLKEKVLSLTGDSFDIKLANGQPILKVQGKLMSVSGRKSVYDMANNHLFDIYKKFLRIHTTFVAENPQGQQIMEVKSGFKILGSKATATFISARSGKPERLSMKGDIWDRSADIVDESTGMIVAQIKRKLSGSDILFGQQTYGVVIAPGVDMALMACMCICLDEKNNEGGGGLLGL